MKSFFITALVSLFFIKVFGFFDSYEKIDENGIHFFEGSWDEAIKLAQAENKIIFLDIYASWCGPCKLLKKTTFSDENVGKYFNERFISVELDGEKGTGKELAQKYEIKGYPSLLFLDKDGDVIIQTAGYYQSSELIHLGKKAQRKSK